MGTEVFYMCMPSQTSIAKEVVKEEKTRKNIIKSFCSKFEIFGMKEIKITIHEDNNHPKEIQVINTEILSDVLDDYTKLGHVPLIATLNGYKLDLEKSLLENFIYENDDLYVSKPIQIYFILANEKKFSMLCSKFQNFYGIYQKFKHTLCPKNLKKKLLNALFNGKQIEPHEIVNDIGIKNQSEIFMNVGNDENTRSIYDKGWDILQRVNFVHLKKEDEEIKSNDYKVELDKKLIDNIEMEKFGKIDFINLKILKVTNCQIKNLAFLKAKTFQNLTELDLKYNLLNFIDNDLFLAKLQILDLSHNQIAANMFQILDDNDANTPFINVCLPQLEILNLSNNEINDIKMLAEMEINNLKELYLNNNEIEQINIFQNIGFIHLQKLDLSNNKINNINIFKRLAFYKDIVEINLMNNEIVNLNVLRDVSLPKLNLINILNNNITDFSVFKLVYFPELKYLFAFPAELDVDDYDKNNALFKDFEDSCQILKQKDVEIMYKI